MVVRSVVMMLTKSQDVTSDASQFACITRKDIAKPVKDSIEMILKRQRSHVRVLGCVKMNTRGKQREFETITQHDPASLSGICTEILMKIFAYCDAVDLLNAAASCKRLYIVCRYCEPLWKELCSVDFSVDLPGRGKFETYYEIYQLLYKSRLVMGAYVYGRYFDKRKLSSIPGWLWCMAALSDRPPFMKYGKTRFLRQCSGHYLQRFAQVPLGQLRRSWGIKRGDDLHGLFPRRVERGTLYYPFQGARYALMRKMNGRIGYYRLMLNKCYRARKIIDKKFELIKGKNPITSL